MKRDLEWVKGEVGGEMDILMEPGENLFRSRRWDLNDWDAGDVSCGNWGVWAFRGKRYVFVLLVLFYFGSMVANDLRRYEAQTKD